MRNDERSLLPRSRCRHHRRRGAIAVLAGLLLTFLIGMVAFAVDYGYLVKVRTDLQRAADAAALAAVQDLIPTTYGWQNTYLTRATASAYAQRNLKDSTFHIADADIEIGRFDPDTIYSQVTFLPTGPYDTVRVTLRRDGVSNPLVPLFFACVLGSRQADVVASATAVLQKAEIMEPGADVLPFATPVELWNSLNAGEEWAAYGDGRLKDALGHTVSGNWGTLDIGPVDNSTSDLCDQILHGLRQEDLDSLSAENRIPDNSAIDCSTPAWLNGDPGLSVGIKASVKAIHGQKRLVPLYDQLSGSLAGSNVDFRVIGWGVVTVVDSVWQGEINSRVILRKSHGYFGELRPKGSLSSGTAYIEGAYTSPVLVQ
jgi:hypothetical protein